VVHAAAGSVRHPRGAAGALVRRRVAPGGTAGGMGLGTAAGASCSASGAPAADPKAAGREASRVSRATASQENPPRGQPPIREEIIAAAEGGLATTLWCGHLPARGRCAVRTACPAARLLSGRSPR